MTKITIYKNQKKEFKGFDCLGHAGYGVEGEDIVCAGISVLVINTMNSIEQFSDTAFAVTTDATDGMIHFRFQESPDAAAQLLINSMILGLQGIKKQYGKTFLTLDNKEV